MLHKIHQIISLSQKRIHYFHTVDNRGYYKGNSTYLQGIKDELIEVENEIKEDNAVYLEDELWDIFWNYLCLLHSLEEEKKIDKQRVFERCWKKFSERIWEDGQWGKNWSEVKKRQKEELNEEHEARKNWKNWKN